jgi:hypothetical protein
MAAPRPADRAFEAIPIWHVVITGFTQKLEHPSGGQYLWNAIRRARHDCEEAACLLEPWNADWAGIATQIWRFRPINRPVRVYVYAYSWGGGWGFPQLAGGLQTRGIEIAHAVLADAVYRPPTRLLLVKSLLRTSQILLPANVREVSWFFQRTGLPMGHQIVAADPKRTKVNPGVECPGVTHHYMDDQPAWWLKSLEVAAAARPAEPFGSLLEKLTAA